MIDQNGFDRDFYLARYPDIARAGVDPYQHFIQYGWKEGRNPNLGFDTGFYLRNNQDVARAGMNPLEHYMKYGWKEGRDPSAAFDTSDYLNVNADVAKAGMNPLQHYLQYGAAEKRPLGASYYQELTEGFDRAYYLKANPDVAKAGIDPYLHYVQFGYAEGRKPDAFFDQAFYLARNPDVARAGINALEHFLTYGWKEGRDPSASFSVAKYRAAAGTDPAVNPLLSFLTMDNWAPWLANEARTKTGVLNATGTTIDPVLVGSAGFVVEGNVVHVTAPGSYLDGRDVTNVGGYNLGRSTADITFSGTGSLPNLIQFGSGNDAIVGNFTLKDLVFTNVYAGPGKLNVDATFTGGSLVLNGGAAGSQVRALGSSYMYFVGTNADDTVTMGSGESSVTGGGGTNVLDGGDGNDTVYWNSQVRADLLVGKAIWLGQGTAFNDTLIGIENIRGSTYQDVLLGDNGKNRIDAVGPAGDLLAGRGGDDVLTGSIGADTLIGGLGVDQLTGGAGNDLLIDRQTGTGDNTPYQLLYGQEGDDRLVFLLGDSPAPNKLTQLQGDAGADIYTIDPAGGNWGLAYIFFSRADGDKLDLSALRTLSGDAVTFSYLSSAVLASAGGATTIGLNAFKDVNGGTLGGTITIFIGDSQNQLQASDVLSSGVPDWHTLVPSEFLPLI